MNHHRTIGSLLATLSLGIAGTLVVQSVRATGIPTPGTLTYSGSLANPDGTPVTATSKNIGINMFEAATGGTPIVDCLVASAPVPVNLGQFQVALPDGCAAKVQASPNLWIEVAVDGASLGRTKLGAVPYAVEAGHALAADSATAATNATNAGALSGALTVLEAASDVTQTGVQSTDLVYTKIGVDLTPGTWLVEAEASVRTTDTMDAVSVGLFDATSGVEIQYSRSAVGRTNYDSTYYIPVSLHTSKVVRVTTPTTVRIKAFRNGTSTLEFGFAPGAIVLAGGRNRIFAVKLSNG